jgi:hypothetical protein
MVNSVSAKTSVNTKAKEPETDSKNTQEPVIDQSVNPDFDLKKYIDDNHSVKIKADLFKNKVAQVSENTITTDDNVDFKNKSQNDVTKKNVNSNVFNFNVKKQENQADKPVTANLTDKQIDLDEKARETKAGMEKLIRNLPPEWASDPILANAVEQIKTQYYAISTSDHFNPVDIMVAASFIDKVLETAEDVKKGTQRDPEIFSKLKLEYNNFCSDLIENINNGQKPSEKKLQAYLGKNAAAVGELVDIKVAEGPQVYTPSSYVTSQIENTKAQITDLIKDKGKAATSYSSNALNVETALMLTDAVSTLEKHKLLSVENYNKMSDLVNKIVTGHGDKLSNDELKELQQFCNQVAANSKKLGLKGSDFNSLSTMIDGLLVARDAVKGKREEFLKQAEVSEKKLEDLVNIVSDPKLKIDANFVEMLNTVKSKYAAAKASGDPVAIAIYSAYLDKIMQTVEDIKSGKQKDPVIFRKIQNEYESFSKNLFQKLGSGQVPVQEIKLFLGDAAGPVISMLESEMEQIKKEHHEVESTGTASPDKQAAKGGFFSKMFENRKNLLTFTPEESAIVSKVNLNGVRKAMEDESVFKAVSEFRASVKDLNIKLDDLNQAELRLKELNDQLVKMLLADSFNNSWAQLGKKPGLMEDVLKEIIDDIIANADRLLAEMDLSVEAGPADMIELLQTFRKIIVQLDIDLRKLNELQREKHLIDEQYLKSVHDNQERQERLSETKLENLQEMERVNSKQINPYTYDLGISN